MKGIIMQRGERKSIVLFNNGKIGEIPTRPNFEEGMIVTVSYNKRFIALIGIVSCIALIYAFFALRSVYYSPFGYVQINYENTAVELAYNRFQRIIAVRPLNQQAVEPIAILRLNNATIETAYEKIIPSLARSPSFPARNLLLVRIAQDNLAGAKKIEQSLSLFSIPLMSALKKEFTVTFELYTHELYREAMTENSQSPTIPSVHHPNSPSQMYRGHNWGMNGRRNMWCW
jgi:hypothetical protein